MKKIIAFLTTLVFVLSASAVFADGNAANLFDEVASGYTSANVKMSIDVKSSSPIPSQNTFNASADIDLNVLVTDDSGKACLADGSASVKSGENTESVNIWLNADFTDANNINYFLIMGDTEKNKYQLIDYSKIPGYVELIKNISAAKDSDNSSVLALSLLNIITENINMAYTGNKITVTMSDAQLRKACSKFLNSLATSDIATSALPENPGEMLAPLIDMFDKAKLFDTDNAFVMTAEEDEDNCDLHMELNIDTNTHDIRKAINPDQPTPIDSTVYDYKMSITADANISPLADGYSVSLPHLTAGNTTEVFSQKITDYQLDYAVNNESPVNLFYNNSALEFDEKPIITNDRTFVPFRKLANSFGIDDSNIGYDEAEERVSLTNGNTNITMYIGSSVAYVNGKMMLLDVPAFTYRDRTYIPVRFVSEMFGKDVDYFEENGAANITIND